MNLCLRRLALGSLFTLAGLTPACKPKKINYAIEIPRYWGYADVQVTRVGSYTDLEGATVVTRSKDQVARGTEMEVAFPTPCGPKTVTFPMPVPSKQGSMGDAHLVWIAVPREVEPVETVIHADPALKGPVMWGNVDVSPDRQTTRVLWDVGCGGKLTVHGQGVVVPPLPRDKVKDPGFGYPDHSVLLAVSKEACYREELLVYGNGDAEPVSRKLTGSMIYGLKYNDYSAFFKRAPSSIRVGSPDGGGVNTRLAHCEGD